jgi:hypothetical protein
LLLGRYNKVKDGQTEIHGRTAWLSEVRVFVSKGEDATMRHYEVPPLMHGVNRRLLVFGARKATLHFLIDPEHADSIRILRDPHFPYFAGNFEEPKITDSKWGPLITIENLNEDILFEW